MEEHGSGRRNNESDASKDRSESGGDNNDASDENQDPLHMSDMMHFDEEDQEAKQTCFSTINQKMSKFMIDPTNTRLK